mmetsp:Transcript_56302/g.150521  ORF Transcript_56302/g.150521 Transcript_56302/m.150521 type:complete len:295 (-) Transcript_56302:26-910(-)|eukprot:CAMPEP_0194488742 /NCGR_PEP_ID=MMETSP0253-20130528/8546_1 /TAXON_ID=2966 /ORGANISM="Noctiluca scintillans" /LENGTH=294 /DNA_ID=CAMNT_0039329137 /DNA_START=116 /DNA_END=1000 /DNA_ORIENTATION=-
MSSNPQSLPRPRNIFPGDEELNWHDELRNQQSVRLLELREISINTQEWTRNTLDKTRASGRRLSGGRRFSLTALPRRLSLFKEDVRESVIDKTEPGAGVPFDFSPLALAPQERPLWMSETPSGTVSVDRDDETVAGEDVVDEVGLNLVVGRDVQTGVNFQLGSDVSSDQCQSDLEGSSTTALSYTVSSYTASQAASQVSVAPSAQRLSEKVLARMDLASIFEVMLRPPTIFKKTRSQVFEERKAEEIFEREDLAEAMTVALSRGGGRRVTHTSRPTKHTEATVKRLFGSRSRLW